MKKILLTQGQGRETKGVLTGQMEETIGVVIALGIILGFWYVFRNL